LGGAGGREISSNFNLYKGFSMKKIDPNSPDSERK
jgi:hypothetical protein